MRNFPAPLHPQVVAFLDGMPANSSGIIDNITVAEFREQFDKIIISQTTENIKVQRVSLISIPGSDSNINARIYYPNFYKRAERSTSPLIVYFHGGGHVVGNLDSHDSVARRLCAEFESIIASIDYRLAPEHKFPAAIEDSYVATKWLQDNAEDLGADTNELSVAGDSAGGNIATVVAIMARDDIRGPRIKFQLLLYPVTDYSCDSNSYQIYGSGFGGLTAQRMLWFQRHYLPDLSCIEDWRASPLKATDLSGLPKALVITAECDVLHDEGEAYAKAMAAAGTKVEYIDWPGMIHGFIGSAAIFDDGREALSVAASHLREN